MPARFCLRWLSEDLVPALSNHSRSTEAPSLGSADPPMLRPWHSPETASISRRATAALNTQTQSDKALRAFCV